MGGNIGRLQELGIKPGLVLKIEDVETIWKIYDTDHEGRLNYKQAKQFVSDYSKAIGIDYSKKTASVDIIYSSCSFCLVDY